MRERPEDVGPIAESVLARQPAGDPTGACRRLSERTLELLTRHPWPGNVRELEDAVIVAAWAVRGEEAIEPEHLPEWFFEEMDAGPGAGSAGDGQVEAALPATHGNVAAAARRLGVCAKTVRRHIAAGGIDLEEVRRAGTQSA